MKVHSRRLDQFDHAIKNSRDYYDAIRQKLKMTIKIILYFYDGEE